LASLVEEKQESACVQGKEKPRKRQKKERGIVVWKTTNEGTISTGSKMITGSKGRKAKRRAGKKGRKTEPKKRVLRSEKWAVRGNQRFYKSGDRSAIGGGRGTRKSLANGGGDELEGCEVFPSGKYFKTKNIGGGYSAAELS